MSSGSDLPSEGVPPEAATGSPESEAAALERRAARAQGEAAVAAFLDEAQLDSSLRPQLCMALEQHGSAPEEWVPTLIAMTADTFEELLAALKEHPPSNEALPVGDARNLTEEEMVQRIFNELDEDKDGKLNFDECVSLAAHTGGSMDRGSYEAVAEMVGAMPSEGLTPAHLKEVYLKFKMGDVVEDWSRITGADLRHGSTDAQPSPSDPVTRRTRSGLLAELERLRSTPFSWDNTGHTELLSHVWSVGAPSAEAITTSERMLLPQRLELLVSLPLFMGFGSRMAQVRLANSLEEVEFEDGTNIITEGEPVNASSYTYCVVAGSPVAISSDIGTLKVYQEGEWFGERGIVLNDPRAASVVANSGTRCLRLSRARIAEVMHDNLAGLEAHFEDVEAKYQARTAQLEGALQYDISSRALHIKFSRAVSGGLTEGSTADADGPGSSPILKNVSGRLAAESKLLPADGGVGELRAADFPTAPRGTLVNVLAAKGEWWEVEVQGSGERGFVAARLVTVGASGDEDDASRLARRAALLRRSVRCLDSLPDTDVKLLAMCLDTTVVGECEQLLRRGEYPPSLLLLEAGSAESRDPETGEVLATLAPGDCVCEEQLILVNPCTTSIVATTDVVCLELRRADLVGLLSDRWSELEEAAAADSTSPSAVKEREELRVHDWTDIGFQNRSPDTDFRAMGSLALHCLEHLATRKPDLLRTIVLAYQADRATHYPPAITAVNITEWLFEFAMDGTLAASHFNPPSDLALGVRVNAVADSSETGVVVELESSHGGQTGGHTQCKVKLDTGRVRTYFAADVAISATPTDGYSVFTFCELFCELYARFDARWKEARPSSVMEFPTISDDFRAHEAARWARDRRHKSKILNGSSATVGAAMGGVASVGGAAVGGVAAVGGMGAAAGKAAVGRLGSGMKGLRRKASPREASGGSPATD